MRFIINTLIISFLIPLPAQAFSAANNRTKLDTVEKVIQVLNNEVESTLKRFAIELERLNSSVVSVNHRLRMTDKPNAQLTYLIQKDQLLDRIKALKVSERTEISKIRYIKGLQIIKLLYEKTLALDHHFASVNTLNEINKLSNPNQYPEFIEVKELLKAKNGKKTGFDLSSILGNNLYASVAHSLISLFTDTSSSKREKETSLKSVECIIDFTLRMHADLNTIYFETKFLQRNNDNIINEVHQLFVDFTKPIGYEKPLNECRDTDDWDHLREYLEKYLLKLDNAMRDTSQFKLSRKMQINLEFPIDRLLQFITSYNLFIDQGAKFYEKFGIMLDSYENEAQCGSKIPVEYQTLKNNIIIATDKFNTAYKPVEINGSKMKEILYGINEYE